MNKQKIEKIFSIVSLCVAVTMLIAGICLVAIPQKSYSTAHTDLAIFGADFYTEIHEAARNAANNISDVVYNLNGLRKANALYNGLTFIFAGLFLGLYNAKKLVFALYEEKENVIVTEAVVEEITENEEVIAEAITEE